MPRKNNVKELVAAHTARVMAAARVKPFQPLAVNGTVPTGCTMLNLAASGNARGGWQAGAIVHGVGDSDTGKSALALTTLAECSINRRFAKYDLIKDDPESSCSFPIAEMFGADLARRMKAPHSGEASYFIEDFYFGVYGRLKAGTPFIYVLDSMDGLESIAGTEKFEDNAKLRARGKEMKGSYGDGKAKVNSENMRKIKLALAKTSSLLFIVSQTRDNINPDTMAEKTHAAGRALKFYSQYQFWMAPRGQLTKSIKGKQVQCGTLARVKFSKNHATGKHLDFVLPFYYGYGIDDEQCTIRWMIAPESGAPWKLSAGVLTTRGEDGLPKTCPVSEYTKRVRSDAAFREAYLDAVQSAWDEYESKLRRPGRYSGAVEDGDAAAYGDGE